MNEQELMEKSIRESLSLLHQWFPNQLNEMIGMEFVSCDAKERSLTLRAVSQPWMANPMNGVHGGISATYVDFAMGILCRYYANGNLTPTIHMDMNFMHTIEIGKPVLVKSMVVKPGSSLLFTRATIALEEAPDVPLVSSAGTYHIPHTPSVKPPAE